MGTTSSRAKIDIQSRDLAVLRGLFDARVMTISQIAALHFEGHQEAAKKRLQKMKAVGLVAERPRRPYEPAVLFLTKSGFVALRDAGILAEYPDLSWAQLEKRSRVSDLTLRHELDVMDAKSVLTLAVRSAPGLEVTEFITWPLLYQFEACGTDGRNVLVKPDGFLRIRQDEPDGAYEHTFFLEVDRSTETQEVLAERASCYRDYYRSGNLARHLHGDSAKPEDVPFRVLFVFTTAERRNNAAERLLRLQPPILRQAWLTTSQELLRDPLGRIWVQPQDYMKVTDGTAYDPQSQRDRRTYRRQSGREELVEARLQKSALISQ